MIWLVTQIVSVPTLLSVGQLLARRQWATRAAIDLARFREPWFIPTVIAHAGKPGTEGEISPASTGCCRRADRVQQISPRRNVVARSPPGQTRRLAWRPSSQLSESFDSLRCRLCIFTLFVLQRSTIARHDGLFQDEFDLTIDAAHFLSRPALQGVIKGRVHP